MGRKVFEEDLDEGNSGLENNARWVTEGVDNIEQTLVVQVACLRSSNVG